MDRTEIEKLINEAISSCNDSMATDWLAYCLCRSVGIKFLGEETVVIKKSIKSGIPAINTYNIVDNDFFSLGTEQWKEDYKKLNSSNFAACIEMIDDIKLVDEEHVNIIKKQVFLEFNNPSN